MILAFAVTAAVLFGAGAYLLLAHDVVRVVSGVMLISQSAVVTIIASSLSRGQAPISPQPGEAVSDPLPQALALTALVIGLATVALLLALVRRVSMVFATADRDWLAANEAQHTKDMEPECRRSRDEAT